MFHSDFANEYSSEELKNKGFFTKHDGNHPIVSIVNLSDKVYCDRILIERHGNFKILALPFLRATLRLCYNLSSKYPVYFKFTPLNVSKKNDIVSPYAFKQKDKNVLQQFDNNIERYLIAFFNSINNVINTTTTIIGRNNYPCRYISYKDWLAVAFLFIYYDGRVFKDIKQLAIPIPYHNKEHACSTFSLRIALDRLLTLIETKKTEILEEGNYEVVLSQLFKIDEIFHFFKINRMNQHRNFLFSEDHISSFYTSFQMTYTEVLNLKDILDEEVFKNDDFINECFLTPHPDPLLIFISYLNTNALAFNLSKTSTHIVKHLNSKLDVEKLSLKELIAITKEETWTSITEYVDRSKTSVDDQPKNLLDIFFWKKYFLEDQKILKDYSKKGYQETIPSEFEYIDYLFEKTDNLLRPKLKNSLHSS